MSLSRLEKRAALQILAYLHHKRRATRTDLKENVEAALKSIYSTLPVLMKLDLIEEEAESAFPFSVYISLTKRGMEVAGHLVEIEGILSRVE